jgi:hypothetical protein
MTDLERLLELARQEPVSAADRETQRLSFAFGNASISDARVTRDAIERAAAELAERPIKVSPAKK